MLEYQHSLEVWPLLHIAARLVASNRCFMLFLAIVILCYAFFSKGISFSSYFYAAVCAFGLLETAS